MEHGTLKEKAYTTIRKKIIECEYMPGAVLSENELMNEIGSSRTPIREALNRLEQEDLVKIVPKRGIWVSELTTGMIYNIYEVRILLEPYVIREYGSEMSAGSLEDIKRLCMDLVNNKQENVLQYDMDTSEKLHLYLLGVCKNTFITNLVKNVYDQNYRMGTLVAGNREERFFESQKEHINIINYILEKKYETAADLLSEHLVKSRNEGIELMMKNLQWK